MLSTGTTVSGNHPLPYEIRIFFLQNYPNSILSGKTEKNTVVHTERRHIIQEHIYYIKRSYQNVENILSVVLPSYLPR